MIDIEFIIANDSNDHAEPGSVWLLECNPRFSGDIHTTLSNPGFLDLYFQVMNGDVDTDGCGNVSYIIVFNFIYFFRHGTFPTMTAITETSVSPSSFSTRW